MRPLHLRVLAADPTRPDLAALIAELQANGHFVATTDAAKRPPGISKLPEMILTEVSTGPSAETLDAAEARHIAAVLHFTGGNKRQSAMILGVARSTLLAKIRKYGLTDF